MEVAVSDSPRDMYGLSPSEPGDYQAMRLDAIRQRWDHKARRWDADLADSACHLNEDDAYDRFLRAAEAAISARAELCRQQTIVDLGCGTGLVLARFADRFSSGVGVDLSPRMIEVAANRKIPNVRWLVGDCFELDRHFGQAAVGAVLSRGVLLSHYGVGLVAPFLGQIRQVLGEKGFVMLDFLNAEARGLYASPENKTYFRSEEMLGLARAARLGRPQIVGEPERRVLVLLAERDEDTR